MIFTTSYFTVMIYEDKNFTGIDVCYLYVLLGRSLNNKLYTLVNICHNTFFRGLDRVIEHYFIFGFRSFFGGSKKSTTQMVSGSPIMYFSICTSYRKFLDYF